MKTLNIFKMWPTSQKTENLGACILQKLKFLQKLSPLMHFHYSSFIAWFFAIIYQNIQKLLSKNEVINNFNMYLLQAKHLVVPLKQKGVKTVLFCFMQQNSGVDLHIN